MMENLSLMLADLTNYYKNNGILSTQFTCQHKDTCIGDCKSFTGPKSAYVGSGYENAILPRLLFLSLDSGSGEQDNQKRLPASVREQEENCNVSYLPKNKHWYLTHQLACSILKKFDQNLNIQDVSRYFAHANSAKCCMNKDKRKKADRILFKNCQEYLNGEIGVLNPDIIVTQGNEAKLAMITILAQNGNSQKERIDDFSSIIGIGETEIFWFHTYHPGGWGYFYKQRRDYTNKEEWDICSQTIYNFIKGKTLR